MSALNDKITALEALLTEREQAMEHKTRRLTIIYVVVVLLVAGYTTIAAQVIRRHLTPESLAEQFQARLNEQIPEMRAAFVREAKTQAPVYVQETFGRVVSSIPLFEQYLGTTLDELTNTVAGSIQSELMPAFTKFIKDEAPQLKAKYADLKDEETGKALTQIFLQVLEVEMDTYFNDRMVGAVESLQKEIALVNKPGTVLSRKQAAERRALQHWAYLAEHKEVGKSLFYDLIQQTKHRFAVMLKEIGQGGPLPEHEILPPAPK